MHYVGLDIEDAAVEHKLVVLYFHAILYLTDEGEIYYLFYGLWVLFYYLQVLDFVNKTNIHEGEAEDLKFTALPSFF